jgi:hypothetical protein
MLGEADGDGAGSSACEAFIGTKIRVALATRANAAIRPRLMIRRYVPGRAFAREGHVTRGTRADVAVPQRRYCRNHVWASRLTCAKAPASSNRCVAPLTISTRCVQCRRRAASRFMSMTA